MTKALESPVIEIATSTPITVTIPDPVNVEFPGPALFLEATADSTPGTPQDFITQVVPINKLWKLRRVEVVSRAYAEFKVTLDGDIIKEGKTSPNETTVSLPFDPWVSAVNPSEIKVVYDQTSGPAVPVTTRLYYTEE